MPRPARPAPGDPHRDDRQPPLPPPAQVPFDVDVALRRIARAVRPYAPAAMFALKEGDAEHSAYASIFQQLVACMLSIRTRDEVSLPIARRLFARASTPAAIAALPLAELDALIAESTFHEAKARQISALAARTASEFGGSLPPDAEILTSFAGVGPKCAHLALGVAAGIPLISVDIHVHRVTNRWGYVAASTPERTLAALARVLPERHHITINRLLVPFGKHVCTGVRPKCATCPVLEMCARVGVAEHR
ncbi:MAG: endonuclease III domain-containing protein [Gemmatirosa sp.]